jgi:hypothetical protein
MSQLAQFLCATLLRGPSCAENQDKEQGAIKTAKAEGNRISLKAIQLQV